MTDSAQSNVKSAYDVQDTRVLRPAEYFVVLTLFANGAAAGIGSSRFLTAREIAGAVWGEPGLQKVGVLTRLLADMAERGILEPPRRWRHVNEWRLTGLAREWLEGGVRDA